MEASGIYGLYQKTWNFKDKWSACARNIANGNGCCKKSNIAFGRRMYPKNCAYSCEAFDKQKKCGGDGKLTEWEKDMIKEAKNVGKTEEDKEAAKKKALDEKMKKL